MNKTMTKTELLESLRSIYVDFAQLRKNIYELKAANIDSDILTWTENGGLCAPCVFDDIADQLQDLQRQLRDRLIFKVNGMH